MLAAYRVAAFLGDAGEEVAAMLGADRLAAAPRLVGAGNGAALADGSGGRIGRVRHVFAPELPWVTSDGTFSVGPGSTGRKVGANGCSKATKARKTPMPCSERNDAVVR